MSDHLECSLCYVALTPESAMSQDPDGCIVPYLQASEAFAELPPPKEPLDKDDPRDTAERICRETLPVCLKCAKELFESDTPED